MRPDLITGATGFIGGHLARRLVRQGLELRVLCRKGSEGKLPRLEGRAEIVHGDLRDRDSLERATRGVRRVYHAAAHVSDWGPESDFLALNVEGTRWLLIGAQAGGAERFVHLSSYAVFGTPAPASFDDASPYGTSKDAYSRTKALGEKTVLAFHAETGLPVTVLRPTVVYGRGSTWLEEPLRMIEKDKMFLLGGGVGTCHPCYAENLVDALLLAAEHPRAVGQAFLVADDDPISFREYFDALTVLAGKGPIQRSIPLSVARAMATVFETTARLTRRSSRPLLTHMAVDLVTTVSRMSMEKIKTELGYVPRYTFRQAMAELAAASQAAASDVLA